MSCPTPRNRECAVLWAGWLVLAIFLGVMGWRNLSAPGLFYDEAIYGGLARDFLTGQATGGHMPGVSTASIFGGPLPIFVQPYLGALKCWLLIPFFKMFGATAAVLRGANLVFSAAALLLCMLWTWRLVGLAEALLGGVLLAMDPAFFFLGVLDWGSLLPSLLCRLAGFLLALTAWRRQKPGWALAAGFVFGLGLFNKIDFGVILAGAGLAAACAGWKLARVSFRRRPRVILCAALGFLAGAAPVLALLRVILQSVFAGRTGSQASEWAEKFQAAGAMYDGSYFYRLMDAGGVFGRMYQGASPVWTPLGIAVALAVIVLAGDVLLAPPESQLRRTKAYLLLATGFISLGALLLPGAVRIHHTTLVYPFPHLLVAAACVSVWDSRWKRFLFYRTARVLTGLVAALLVVCSLGAIQRTEDLIRETGGSGWWSKALGDFAAGVADRKDLTISSLDWGFNEQLEFLTHGPRLEEPFWQFAFGQTPALPSDAQHVYLVHADEFSLSSLGAQFRREAAGQNTNAVIKAWADGRGRTVFYTITFRGP